MNNILITGGTGTLGNALVKRLYGQCGITIYSRSEFLQAQMRKVYPDCRYVLGDVRDRDRLKTAVSGHDTVFHFAAMKRIPECEEQASECYSVNVQGSYNVAVACMEMGVERCVATSTDKACQPVTAYGASKFMMEKMYQSFPASPTKFTLVRYGNVLQSRGSVIPIWRQQAESGRPVTITDASMTRFWMTPDQAVDLVMCALDLWHGAVLVPKMKALVIAQMAAWICPGSEMVEVGLRSMERTHEWLVSPDEWVTERPDHFIISDGEKGYSYTSHAAPHFEYDEFMDMLAEVES